MSNLIPLFVVCIAEPYSEEAKNVKKEYSAQVKIGQNMYKPGYQIEHCFQMICVLI